MLRNVGPIRLPYRFRRPISTGFEPFDQNITQRYQHIVYLQNKEKEYAYISDIYARFSQSANRQYEQGEITYLEKLNAQAKQQQIEIRLRQVKVDLQTAYQQLKLLLQTDEDFLVADQPLEPFMVAPSSIQAGLKVYDERLRYEQAMLGVERNRLLPNISIELFNGTNRYENARNYWGWQVGIAVPLFFGEQKSKIQARKYGVEIAENLRQNYRLSLDTRRTELMNELEKYRSHIVYYHLRASTSAMNSSSLPNEVMTLAKLIFFDIFKA
jgi:cobalt-zinc-cadmium resistance protein CzcA